MLAGLIRTLVRDDDRRHERAPLPTLLLAVRASRHDVVTYAVLVRRGGKH